MDIVYLFPCTSSQATPSSGGAKSWLCSDWSIIDSNAEPRCHFSWLLFLQRSVGPLTLCVVHVITREFYTSLVAWVTLTWFLLQNKRKFSLRKLFTLVSVQPSRVLRFFCFFGGCAGASTCEFFPYRYENWHKPARRECLHLTFSPPRFLSEPF